ncbi:MAG: phosphoribosylamine--glycine ligase [Cyanobacteriota bacterium]|nr:phosphoribosylamine--glycine ligase [Cyanobacteriota bacterium]
MQVLIVGSGGREHALAWKLAQSTEITQIYCAPGNAGIRLVPKCQTVPLAANDIEGLLRFATVQGIGLTVVGSEVPLVEGIRDTFAAAGLALFGPSQAAAQLEGSKAWTKDLLRQAGIATAEAAIFTEREAALAYVYQQPLPIVVKADGLAAGKGVIVAQSYGQAAEAIQSFLGGSLQEAGKTLVIEQFLRGQEVSVLAFTDGQTCLPLLAAQDHKPIGVGDTGPNTGGMGAYCPVDGIVTPVLMQRIQTEILLPTLSALRQKGILYQGILYAGLMISPSGDPYVLEYNCRFGDPETQVLLPLLKTPLLAIMQACLEGRLAEITLEWWSQTAACVVMASAGYPDHYERGKPISGLAAATQEALVFHAGTRLLTPAKGGSPTIVTDGGRVLCITGCGDSLAAALQQAYRAVAHIQFEGAYFRPDIGFRVLGSQPQPSRLAEVG